MIVKGMDLIAQLCEHVVSPFKDALERFENVSHAQIRTNVDEPVVVCRTDILQY